MKNIALRYAPNLAGTSYVAGNLMLMASGGAGGDWWQLAAGSLWLVDGTILGWFGRTARGIEIHSAINIMGCLCMLVAATGLTEPMGQVLSITLLMAGSFLKIIAPPADRVMAKPVMALAWPWYYARRYPMSAVAIIALCSRPFIIYGAIVNGQWVLLVASILWVMGDMFQFLSRKGGYGNSVRAV